MQVVSVESSELILPEELPLGQRMFFEHVMRLDNHHRSCSLETYTSLDTDDRIANVHVAADGIPTCDRLQRPNGLNPIVIPFTVQRHELTLLESQRNAARLGLFQL